MFHHPLLSGRARARTTTLSRKIAAVAMSLGFLASGAAEEAPLFRVETAVYDSEDAEHPVARSLTLFRDGIAWDFLERLSKEGDTITGEPAEIVLHDPARERVILIDPARQVKTQIDVLRLERLRASLATWARSAEDPQLRWAGGPDFAPATDADGGGGITLEGPRVRYVVSCDPAPNEAAAEAYRRFADTALLVKALVHPGGLPPYPRIAINERLAAANALPAAVRLEIEPRLGKFAGRTNVMRSEHRALGSWSNADHKRVAAAEERISVAASVDLADYASPSGVLSAERAGSIRQR